MARQDVSNHRCDGGIRAGVDSGAGSCRSTERTHQRQTTEEARVIVNASRIASLREQGHSWSQITTEMKIGKGTAQRALVGLPKIEA
jgi:hypothetical protein